RHPIVLQGLTSVLAAERDIKIVASCGDGASCLEAIRNLTPDVAIVDVSMHDLSGLEILAIANAEATSTKLILYTASIENAESAAAVAAGAWSVIPKDATVEILVQILRQVAGDSRSVPPTSPDPVPSREEGNCAIVENVLAVLTDREREIMRLVSEGLSNKAVARRLNICHGTIKVHLHHIYRKLEINNRTALAALSISQELLALAAGAADDEPGSAQEHNAAEVAYGGWA